MGEFVDFDPAAFPYVFDCGDCGDELHVTHEQAEDVSHAGMTIREAVDTVRRSKGWWIDVRDVKCPDCIVLDPSEQSRD